MRIEVDTKQLAQMQQWLKFQVDKGNKGMIKALGLTAKHIEAQARQMAPNDTGFLMKSIRASETVDGWEVTSHADYSYWVEFGTRRNGPRPFFEPSVATGFDYLESLIKKIANGGSI